MSFYVKNSILAKTADEPLWLLTGDIYSMDITLSTLKYILQQKPPTTRITLVHHFSGVCLQFQWGLSLVSVGFVFSFSGLCFQSQWALSLVLVGFVFSLSGVFLQFQWSVLNSKGFYRTGGHFTGLVRRYFAFTAWVTEDGVPIMKRLLNCVQSIVWTRLTK